VLYTNAKESGFFATLPSRYNAFGFVHQVSEEQITLRRKYVKVVGLNIQFLDRIGYIGV
jgi:hypothetical protein